MYMIMVLIGKVVLYKIGFGLFFGLVYYVFYLLDLYGILIQDFFDVIECLFKLDIEVKQVVVIIFELVQGEGGFNVVLKELVVVICCLCDEYGIVMIVDEV